MTAKQKEKIIEVIKGDATAECQYITPSDDMCVIGGLAYAAGVSKDVLRTAGQKAIGTQNVDESIDVREHHVLALALIRETIEREYGLGIGDQIQLQCRNDYQVNITPWDSIHRRREALIKMVEEFTITETA